MCSKRTLRSFKICHRDAEAINIICWQIFLQGVLSVLFGDDVIFDVSPPRRRINPSGLKSSYAIRVMLSYWLLTYSSYAVLLVVDLFKLSCLIGCWPFRVMLSYWLLTCSSYAVLLVVDFFTFSSYAVLLVVDLSKWSYLIGCWPTRVMLSYWLLTYSSYAVLMVVDLFKFCCLIG